MVRVGLCLFLAAALASAALRLNSVQDAASGSGTAQAITDESLRLAALGAIFPNAAITAFPVPTTEYSGDGSVRNPALFFPDALKSDRGYKVVAPLIDRAERCAASDDVSGQVISDTRELRFQAYTWPGAKDWAAGILVIAQYGFAGANPPGACTSIARIARVVRRDGQWRKSDDLVLETTHHTGLQRIQLVDLNGEGIDELVVESDMDGGGTLISNLVVFSLRNGRFEQWLNVPSRVEGPDSEYAQTLDITRTGLEKARTFCFTKTVFAIDDKSLEKPRTTTPCYRRLTGRPARVEFFDAPAN